jgi:hypothetical protein
VDHLLGRCICNRGIPFPLSWATADLEVIYAFHFQSFPIPKQITRLHIEQLLKLSIKTYTGLVLSLSAPGD